MVEQDVLLLIGVFVLGVAIGMVLLTAINRVRAGAGSPTKLKQELQDYQEAVEQHFDETSRKFKDMTAHYQDLYQHLATGATNLCRTENISPALSELSDSEPLLVEKAADNVESSDEDKSVNNDTDDMAKAESQIQTKTQQDQALADSDVKNKESDKSDGQATVKA